MPYSWPSSSKINKNMKEDIEIQLASSAGLEPATHCLEGSCSNPTELRGDSRIIY